MVEERVPLPLETVGEALRESAPATVTVLLAVAGGMATSTDLSAEAPTVRMVRECGRLKRVASDAAAAAATISVSPTTMGAERLSSRLLSELLRST